MNDDERRANNIALYREWRPKVFRDVVEQEHVVKTLINSIKRNRLAHAYLFCGMRGTGKTTLAKILARAVNCLNSADGEPCNECEMCTGIMTGRILDVVEIDAASNNSVDNIRSLRDDISYAPARARYKVYIIDEVHMLSGGAFNALLKTLEEPPSYALFILATTEPHKLPATILSRCQRFDLRRITDGAIIGRLEMIAADMGVTAEKQALRLIAKLSEGALRDAISIFDQCAASLRRRDGAGGDSISDADDSIGDSIGDAIGESIGESIGDAGKLPGGLVLTLNDVQRVAGRPGDDVLLQCARIMIERDVKAIPEHVASITSAGMSLIQYIDGVSLFFRNMMMIKLDGSRESFPEIDDDTFWGMRDLCNKCDLDCLLVVVSEFSALAGTIKNSSNQTVLLEITMAKISLGRYHCADATESINARIGLLEKRIDEIHAARVPDKSIPATAVAATEAVAASTAVAVTGLAAASTEAAAVAATEAETGTTAVAATEAVAASAAVAASTAVAVEAVAATTAVTPTKAVTAAAAAAMPEPINQDVWRKIIAGIKSTGNMLLFSVLSGSSAQTLGDTFYVVVNESILSMRNMATIPDNISLLRDEIQSATGRTYRINIISEKEAQMLKSGDNNKDSSFLDIAHSFKERYGIPTSVYP